VITLLEYATGCPFIAKSSDLHAIRAKTRRRLGQNAVSFIAEAVCSALRLVIPRGTRTGKTLDSIPHGGILMVHPYTPKGYVHHQSGKRR
jgi:hypothetical protein